MVKVKMLFIAGSMPEGFNQFYNIESGQSSNPRYGNL